MASASKVSWAKLRVGITAIVAMILVGVLIYLLTGTESLFSHDVILYTYFNDAAAVAVGAQVRVNGIGAGNVKNVVLTQDTDPRKIVRVEMAVREDMLMHIPVDSTAVVSAETLLGAKFINIKKGNSRDTVKAGATIPALQSKDLTDMMESFFPLLTSAQKTLERIDNIVETIESGKGNIGKLINDDTLYAQINTILAEFQKTARALNAGQSTISKLMYQDDLYNDIKAPIQRADRIMQLIEEGKGTAGKLLKDPTVYDELHKNLAVMRSVLEDLQSGKGTAGKLLKSDELHNQIAGLIRKVDITVDKLNQGQGTLGQLLVNPQLYESINNLTREMNGLMKDFRSNPKKFLHIKLGLF